MFKLEVVVFAVFIAAGQAFWWSPNSNSQTNIDKIDDDVPAAKQIPIGYFRSFMYQPFLAYPPPPIFPKYYNPMLNWQQEFLPQPQPMTAQTYFTPTSKPIQTSLSAQVLLNSISSLARTSLEPSPTISPVLTTPRTTTTSTTPASTTTTSTTPVPTTSKTLATTTLPPPSEVPITQIIPTTQYFEQTITPIRALITNRRNVMPFRRPFQQPISDPLTQQYFANYLTSNGVPLQHIQFVPCMCPVAVGMPIPGNEAAIPLMSSDLNASRRSDDFVNDGGLDEVEDDDIAMDGALSEQTSTNGENVFT